MRTQISQSEREFNAVRDGLELLARAVILQMNALKSAIDTNDQDVFRSIVETDKEIDNLELKLDDICVLYMQNRAPLGHSLRYMVGSIDIAAGLERVGDCIEYVARHLAETSQLQQSFPEAWGLLRVMIFRCADILDKAYESWMKQDAEEAKQIPALDSAIDMLQSDAYELVINAVRSGKIDVEPGLSIVMMANKIESIADIACHIAETVVFIISARHIRHEKLKAK